MTMRTRGRGKQEQGGRARRLLRVNEGSAADVQERQSMLYLWTLIPAEAALAAFQQSP
jgi:hypothetical protein